MAITKPTITKDEIIFITKNNDTSLRKFTVQRILNTLEDSNIDELFIKSITIVDAESADSQVKAIAPNNGWFSVNYGLGMGKCIGMLIDGQIMDYVFYNLDLFYNLQNPSIAVDSPKVYQYVIDHELGHSKDHRIREAFEAPELWPGNAIEDIAFILPNVFAHSLYKIKGEFTACYHSAYAASQELIEVQEFELVSTFNSHLNNIKESKKYINTPQGRMNLNYDVANLCTDLLVSYAKLSAYRLGNESLKGIEFEFAYSFPRPIYYLFETFEKLLADNIPLYPNFPAEFDAEIIKCIRNVAAVYGYIFTVSPEGDYVYFT